MNALVDKFGDKIAVLGVPSNQFGHQTNEGDDEFVNTLKHVRPGNGFEFKGELFACTKVNGAGQLPVFKWMKESKPIPFDDGKGDSKGNGCNDNDALILPRGAFDSTTVTLWSPVARSDIAWNFEKFLIGKDGEIIERFSRYYPTVCACVRVCARGCASLSHCQPRGSAPSLVCACARACACACALVPCATGQVSRVSTCACGMPSLKMHARIQADIAAHIEKAL